MKRFLFVLTTFFFLFGAVQAYRADGKKPPQESTYHALIIGNNQYKYLPKLKTAKNDAVEVERLLKDKFHFKTELLLDATRADILDRINGFRKRLRKEDNLLIYYAGHGDYKKEAEKAYWLPVDAQRDSNTNWIIVDDITSNIKMIASRHILVISDSCYSGTLAREAITELLTGEREEYLKKMVGRPSRTLMASGGNEPVSDSGGGNNSVFADALLKSLKETGKDAFTAQEIFPRIKEIVAGRSDQIPEYNNIRNSGHDGGDFVFVLPKQIAGLGVQEREEKDKFSIDDLEKKDKADRATWNTKLKNMKTAFEKAGQFEKKKGSPGLKVEAWQRFLDTYQEKNPYSDEDTRLRVRAEEKIKQWQAGKETLAGGKARLEAEKKQEEERRKQAEEQHRLETERVKAEKERKELEARQKQEEDQQRLEAGKKVKESVVAPSRPYQFPHGSTPPSIYTDPVTEMEFVLVKGGCYLMGDTFGDGNSDEKPVHDVCVDDFFMGKYEVTQRQWETIMENNPSYFKWGYEHPVEQVSWNDVQDCILKLNQKANRNYRLPTEAEWEYAARSGGKREKWAGANSEAELGDYAWYSFNSSGSTNPVGKKKPNSLGLYDMSGNVWEWVQDHYDNRAYNLHSRINPLNISDSFRVIRGGSCSLQPKSARNANRYQYDPQGRYRNLGFRIVLPK